MSNRAELRVCASCEWIFKDTAGFDCPRCGFGSYGARRVFGNSAYRYAKSQEPWMRRQMDKFSAQLEKIIDDSHPSAESFTEIMYKLNGERV